MGRPQDAIMCYQRATQLRPDYAIAYGKPYYQNYVMNLGRLRGNGLMPAYSGCVLHCMLHPKCV